MEIQEQRRVCILQETKGIGTHFWKKNWYEDLLGRRHSLTEEMINTLLRSITQLTNLEKVREEWPYINWEGIVGRNWKASILGDNCRTSRVRSIALGSSTSGLIGRYLPRFGSATRI